MASSFGGWLKQRRKAHGLSQQELAQQVGCSAVFIRKIEADERRPSRQMGELIIRQMSIEGDNRETLLRLARQRPVPYTDASQPPDIASTPSTPQPLSPLTERETEILQLLLADLGDITIAEQLSLKISTIRWYVKQIYSKLGVHSRAEAMQQAETSDHN